MFVGLALSLPDIKYDGICHTTDVPRTLLINGGAEVAFQAFLFFLTLYKFIQSLRHEGWTVLGFWTRSRSLTKSLSLPLSRSGCRIMRTRAEGRRGNRSGSGIPIMRMIARDGTWAFFVLFGLVVAQAIVYIAGEGGILFGWVLSSFSFCAYRILFNLNYTHHSRSHSGSHTYSRATTLYISFDSHSA
ncbi:hypothetical protein VKT23_007835 [Stygiomarasmius scandens]|uniref:Uncharacterized protein n=1 Tax=Marasmiellus scandens TaxID=2682957 RepID=A0ABR1JNY7_9AGAR